MKRVFLGALVLAVAWPFGQFAWKFVEVNIIEPEPYRLILKQFLAQARSVEDREERKAKENLCFRVYPHFN